MTISISTNSQLRQSDYPDRHQHTTAEPTFATVPSQIFRYPTMPPKYRNPIPRTRIRYYTVANAGISVLSVGMTARIEMNIPRLAFPTIDPCSTQYESNVSPILVSGFILSASRLFGPSKRGLVQIKTSKPGEV